MPRPVFGGSGYAGKLAGENSRCPHEQEEFVRILVLRRFRRGIIGLGMGLPFNRRQPTRLMTPTEAKWTR